MGYNDLTNPFEGENSEWNTLEPTYNDKIDDYNDLTYTVNETEPVSYWNDKE